MRIFLTMILYFCVNNLFAQKSIIDSVAYKQWPSIKGPTISKNGQYVFYNIENVPVGSKTLVVQSTNGKWKKEFKGGLKDLEMGFSDKYFLFINNNDSLGMFTLGTNHVNYIPKVAYFTILDTKEGECIAYLSSTNLKERTLKNLKTGREKSFSDVDSWSYDKDMLILLKPVNSNDQKQSINIVDIATGKVSKIWEGYKPENLILDVNHQQLAFKSADSVWYYKTGLISAVCISDKKSSDIEPGFTLGRLDSFSKDGKFLITSLVKKKGATPQNGIVRIWSYTDAKLQTEQEELAFSQGYFAVLDIEAHHIICLQQQEGESFQFSESASGILALVHNSAVPLNSWSVASKLTWGLVSVEGRQKKALDFLDNVDPLLVKLSPHGKYIIYFDKITQNYFSYEIAANTIRNLTKGLEVSWINMGQDDRPGCNRERPRGMVSRLVWLKDDRSVLVYDRYDIWKLDPLNIEKPVNLTNSYGKKNEVIFSYITSSNVENIADKNSRLYLTAFNTENKNNGLFLKQLDKVGDPELLHMGPYLYQTNSEYIPSGSDFPPIKAKEAEMYIVRRMTSTDAPNYFSTNDFKTFTRLSDLQPQKKYNWYTTELHHWKSLDGRTLKGVLYKPENFDPNKKYPVIFHYYERKSDGLNVFLQPAAITGGMNIDIPSYVSNGYLVFSPDIYYKVGDPMEGAYNAVVSAATYVSTLPFVNVKKMGLQGGSFGGVQTNYLTTRTNLFAAAESSSGLADLVSSYGEADASRYGYFEFGQGRIGKSLWERPEAYIKNSTIFQVDKITTPLLLMHGEKDDGCLFINIMEFYLGLRRLGKKVWLLSYPKAGHGIGGKDADDFSLRMMQFFNHYLKDEPAPLWMIDGVLAKDRSWKAGLELDTKGRTPGPGLLTAEEQQKVDSMRTRKPITITLK